VLTGKLDDGTAGLWAIKARGGIAIVQSLQEAEHLSMPENASRHVKIDYTLKIAEMPAVLASLEERSSGGECRGILPGSRRHPAIIAAGQRAGAGSYAEPGAP
jgi:hypothetical protein